MLTELLGLLVRYERAVFVKYWCRITMSRPSFFVDLHAFTSHLENSIQALDISIRPPAQWLNFEGSSIFSLLCGVHHACIADPMLCSNHNPMVPELSITSYLPDSQLTLILQLQLPPLPFNRRPGR